MYEKKDREGESGPKPADFYKEDVEDVAFLGEIRRGDGRRMGLRCRIIRGDASMGFEEGKQGAKQESRRVDGEK